MKTIIWIAVVIILIVLFGTIPLSIISQVFEWFSKAFSWLADTLDIFGWRGLI